MPHGEVGVRTQANAVAGPCSTISGRVCRGGGGMVGAAQDAADRSVAAADVLWVPEPGACGGRIDPDQHLVPSWLAGQLDWHLRPSASPWATTQMARTSCAHV